ncbi:MAG TPA: DNA polymerase III subunit gamma/tau [Candidatus Angelobacter sp.]|jgi:DNA polymerase-3 subunit gamma/tau|nr:DNA polymerase III subunit gamma/tau [Candidatus Angelobacter sp.]
MSYQVLARKYRPQRFSEVIGQEHVTRTLKNAIEQQRIAHGYIFSGHRGIGKTTIARILAMALNCRATDQPNAEPCGVCESCVEVRAGGSVDVIEIDAATNRGIDEIRELRDAARYRPARDRFKIYILDEAHQITDAAFNALLKTLEEPPPHIIFMMATTQAEDIPQTIRSRCQHFSFHAVKFDEIVRQLGSIAAKENITADDEALAVLAEAGDGSMRDALSIMDQAIACCGTSLSGELVRGLVGNVGSEVFEDLMGTVTRGSSEDALRTLDRLMIEGHNPAHFARQLVRFLRNAVVAKVAGDDSSLLQISSDERARVGRVASQFSEEDLARFLQIMLRTFDELGYRQEQRFHLELGVLKLVHAQRILPLEQILSQIGHETQRAPEGQQAHASRPAPVAASPAVASLGAPRQQSPVSPFEADRARKGRSFDPEMSATQAAPQAHTSATATAVAVEEPRPTEDPATTEDPGTILGHVVVALEKTPGGDNLGATLAEGSAALQGNELIITVARPQSVIPFMMNPEQKQIAVIAATAAAGRPLKVTVIGGVKPDSNGAATSVVRPRNGASARSRAAEDPIVQRMREKFGAEIRTVIDHREKN